MRSHRSVAQPLERSRERLPAKTRRVGVLGGTFDPIHVGHLIVAQEVVSALQLDKMYFLPAGDPPHKRDHLITPAHHRRRMVELAIADNPAFALSLVDLERAGPSYTVDTLRLLHEQWGPETSIAFVIGWDMLDDLLTWHDPKGVVRQVDQLVAVHRPGYPLDQDYLRLLEATVPGIRKRLLPLEVPQIAISSSDLRQRVETNRPIRYQVPAEVETYILEQGLYRHPVPVWPDPRHPMPRHAH